MISLAQPYQWLNEPSNESFMHYARNKFFTVQNLQLNLLRCGSPIYIHIKSIPEVHVINKLFLVKHIFNASYNFSLCNLVNDLKTWAYIYIYVYMLPLAKWFLVMEKKTKKKKVTNGHRIQNQKFKVENYLPTIVQVSIITYLKRITKQKQQWLQ